MKKIAISVLVLLAMLLVSCADQMETSDVLAARKAAEGDIKWDAKFVGEAYTIIPLKSTRNNASGKDVIKITSNAHSADCEGIYFRWEDKQKDDGFLLVSEEFMATNEGFLLTTKVSNTYWDYPITIQDGQEPIDGLYVFKVPKGKAHKYIDENGDIQTIDSNEGCGKNINMVFISNLKLVNAPISEIFGETVVENKYVISFTKKVTDVNFEDGVPLPLWTADKDNFTFTVTHESGKFVESGLKLDDNLTITLPVPYDGNYIITETFNDTDGYVVGKTATVQPIKATKTISLISQANGEGKGAVCEVESKVLEGLGGKDILNVWKDGLPEFDAKLGKAKFIWDRADSWLYGLSGSAVIHYSTKFNLTQAEIDAIDKFDVYFAADNAAVMFVNKDRVGYTYEAISEENIAIIEKDGFKDFSNKAFLGDKWQVIYKVDIKNSLVAGENVVKFYAANSDTNDGIYDITNNPCGLIFFGEVVIETGTGEAGEFVNEKALVTNEKGELVKNNGTTGYDKVSTGNNSWFTYAKIPALEDGKWTILDVIKTNSGNGKIDVVGKVFVIKNGDDLKVVINGTNASYHYQILDKAPISENGQSNAASGNGSVLNLKYKPNLYLKVSANFYRF